MMSMAAVIAAGVLVSASSHGPVAVRFDAYIMSTADIAIVTHDLGPGILAHVATYSDGVRHETVEMLACAGDRVSFDAATQLVATRTGSDLKEIPVRFARR